MFRSTILRAALGATLAAGAFAAQASTVVLSSWTFGSGNSVNASAPVYNGQAGGFSGTLDGNALQTYCVELTQVFYWNTAYTNYVDVAASTYFTAADNKADKLGRLLSYVKDSAGAVDTSAESTSLQLAIWNIVYDTDYSLSAGGAFSDTSAYGAYATSLLGASQNWANSLNVYVLSSSTAQDQLHWSNKVPEPASLALAALALGVAGAASRRKRSSV